jgi:hypothetical protein
MRWIRRVVAVLIIGSLVSWYAYTKVAERKANEKAQQTAVNAEQMADKKNQEDRRLVSDLARRYNAMTSWYETLYRAPRFTIDAQEALIDPAGRPVLFLGTIDDVVKRDGRFYVDFKTVFDGVGPDFWHIECTGEQVARIRTHDLQVTDAVIAKINSVAFDLPFDGTNLVATGQCVDLLILDTDKPGPLWPE